MTRYIGVIDGKVGAYGLHFPDLPGAAAMGKTIEAAIANGATVLREWVEDAEGDGRAVPAPRALEALHADPDVMAVMAMGATAFVTVPLVRATGKPGRANLSIDAGILAAIDAEATRRDLTRSALIEAMAREMLPRMT